MTNVIIYHANCPDGMSAALAAYMVFGDEATYVPEKHGNTPDYELCKDANVYIVDFCYPRAQLEELRKHASRIVILDHHVTAKRYLEDPFDNDGCEVEVTLDMKRSGAVIAWEYFHPTTEVPLFYKYVQDRDLWTLELPNIDEVSRYYFATPYTFEAWKGLLETDIADMIESGTHMLRQFEKDVSDVINNAMHWLKIGENVIPVVNIPFTHGSVAAMKLLDIVPECQYSAYYMIKGECVYLGLRSRDESVDVSKIAESMGGGGHKCAAACQLPHKKLLELLHTED